MLWWVNCIHLILHPAVRISSKRFLIAKGSKTSSVNTLQWKKEETISMIAHLYSIHLEPTPAGRKALLLIQCNCDAYFEGHYQRRGYRGMSYLPNIPRVQQKFASKICWCYTIDVICPASLQGKRRRQGKQKGQTRHAGAWIKQ